MCWDPGLCCAQPCVPASRELFVYITRYCFPLRTASRFGTALHTLYKKKIRAPLPVQMPLVQQQPGRALFAVGSGAGAGRARLGSALVALLMARCFHVCRWLRASGVHSGPWWLSFPQPWMVSSSPRCSGMGGGLGFVGCLWFLVPAAAFGSLCCRSLCLARLGGEQHHCSVIWATSSLEWLTIIYRAGECVSCSVNTAWLSAGNMLSNSWLNLHTFSVM